MASATITLTDAPGGGVDVVVTFSDPGMDTKHPAHDIAVGLSGLALDLQAKSGEEPNHG